jgi:hypothetical protein
MDASFLFWVLTFRKMSSGTFWVLSSIIGRLCTYKHDWSRQGKTHNGQSAKVWVIVCVLCDGSRLQIIVQNDLQPKQTQETSTMLVCTI